MPLDSYNKLHNFTVWFCLKTGYTPPHGNSDSEHDKPLGCLIFRQTRVLHNLSYGR